MKKAPFALKSPFYIHGFLYVLAAHLSGYQTGLVAFLLLPADLVHLPYLFALGGCVLSLPLFLLWFFRNETPVGYLITTAVSHLAVSIGGAPLLLIPLLLLAEAVTMDPDKMNPWSFLAIWLSIAVIFGALLVLLCLGLLVYALIRKKRACAKEALTEITAETTPDPIPETTSNT